MALSAGEGRKISWADRDKAGVLGHLTAYDFLDRVVNIKLYFSNGSRTETAVIRSDFEAYDSNTWKNVLVNRAQTPSTVRKCVVKPSIKVQYRQTGSNVATELDVYIDNFFSLSGGEMLMQFHSSGFKLAGFELHLGYFGQFASMYAAQPGGVPTLSQLYEMKQPGGSYSIRCDVDYVVTEKLPPDAQIKIHGFVGSTYNMPVDENAPIPYTADDVEKKTSNWYDSIPQWVFENVTRRYKKVGYETVVGVTKGRMPSGTAKKKGVNVWYSEGVAKSYYLTGRRVRKAADGTQVSGKFFSQLTWGSTVMKTLYSLAQYLSPNIRLRAMTDGSWLMFTAEESAKYLFYQMSWYEYNPALPQTQPTNSDGKITPASVGLAPVVGGFKTIAAMVEQKAEGVDVKTLLSAATKNSLPAVYNITQDALCTITCPFSTFIPNFSKVYFSARYARSNLVTYYAGSGKPPQEFTVLWQDVSFATVDDVNDVLLTCTAGSGEE